MKGYYHPGSLDPHESCSQAGFAEQVISSPGAQPAGALAVTARLQGLLGHDLLRHIPCGLPIIVLALPEPLHAWQR